MRQPYNVKNVSRTVAIMADCILLQASVVLQCRSIAVRRQKYRTVYPNVTRKDGCSRKIVNFTDVDAERSVLWLYKNYGKSKMI